MSRMSVRGAWGLVLLGLVACGGGMAGAPATPGPAAGGGAGDTTLRAVHLADLVQADVFGQAVTRADTEQARALVLSFWATWCKPCKAELPLLSDLSKRLGARGLAVFAVSIDDAANAAAVQEYAQTQRFAFRVLHDEDGSLARELNPRLDVPYTLVLDGAGRVAHVHRGFTTADLPRLEAEVDALLAAAP